MCGHVGVAGKLEFKDEATAKRLLLFDYFRGPDSTGFAAVSGDSKTATVVKMASHPVDLFDSKRFVSALSGWNSSVFLGHNRLATKGAVSGVNAHPFHYGDIIGAHNGTLTMWSWDKLNEINGEKSDVDSQAVFMAIDKVGIEEVAPVLQGAWALVWYDMAAKTLNFLKNKERPLWYAYDKEFKRVFWSSEWPAMDAAISMSTQGYEMYHNDEGHRFFSFKDNWLYTYDMDELREGYKSLPNPRMAELKGKEVVSVVNTYHGSGTAPFQRTNSGSPTGCTSNKGKKPKVVNLMGTADNPFDGVVSEARLNELAKYGCSWCSSTLDFTEPGVTIFDTQDSILCPTCSGHDHNRVYTSELMMQAYGG